MTQVSPGQVRKDEEVVWFVRSPGNLNDQKRWTLQEEGSYMYVGRPQEGKTLQVIAKRVSPEEIGEIDFIVEKGERSEGWELKMSRQVIIIVSRTGDLTSEVLLSRKPPEQTMIIIMVVDFYEPYIIYRSRLLSCLFFWDLSQSYNN